MLNLGVKSTGKACQTTRANLAEADWLDLPSWAILRLGWVCVGRRVRLSTLLKINGHGAKAGTGCDAPGWWKDTHGKLR